MREGHVQAHLDQCSKTAKPELEPDEEGDPVCVELNSRSRNIAPHIIGADRCGVLEDTTKVEASRRLTVRLDDRFTVPGPGIRANAMHGRGWSVPLFCSARSPRPADGKTCLLGVGELHVRGAWTWTCQSLTLTVPLRRRSGPTDDMRTLFVQSGSCLAEFKTH
jgi:hypothetical protein